MEKKTDFKIRKGLEVPLSIKGMQMKYFYIFSCITGGLILFLVGKLMNLSQDLSFSAFVNFLISVVVCLVILVGVKIYFTAKTDAKAYKFTKKRIYLSNRNITKVL